MSVAFLNQFPIHYESLGRGRPVVFLHSWVGSWRYWVPSMQAASASHSNYALDLPGFGDTASSPMASSIEQLAALVRDFLDEMGIGRIAVVGHGLGALVGMTFARLQPVRVARMMTVALPLDPTTLDTRLYSSKPAELLELLAGRLTQFGELLPRDVAVPERVLNVDEEATQIRRSLAALQAAQVPCLLLYGGSDPLLPPPSPEHISAFDANFQQVVFPDCGHFPMLEAADRFNRLMTDFLALEAGTSPRHIQPKEEWRRRVR